jgi:serine/threonine-protein kinase
VVTRPLFELDNGRYSILKKLGGGNFGDVYEGLDNDQGERVAVKVFKPWVVVDEVVREATNQAKLRGHDHIVDLRNVRPIPPVSFMVMEYLPEGSVKACFDADRANLIEIVRWIRNGLDGLAYAHAQGILHRDFKPANLMLATNGTAKLSDFGIAEDTIKGQVVGKLYGALWAPELLKGGPSSVQTDIWAVGCSLYYLLTGSYPFGMPIDPTAVFAGKFKPIHEINPQIPMSVVRVIEKALAVNPALRYSGAWAMLSELLDCNVHRAWRRYDDPSAV